MIESEAYKTYYTYATGKRLKTIAKVPKSGKKKLPAQGLETLSEIALSKAEQMKIATKRSRTQFHVSHVSGLCAHEGTSISPRVPDVPHMALMMSRSLGSPTESDNDGDDFVHPKLSTFDEEERHNENHDEEEEEGLDLRVQTPSHFESNNDKAYDDVIQGDNVEEEKLDEDKTHEEESSSVSSGFISNMLNPNSDISIDPILNLNTESTSLVDVIVTANLEMPPSSVTTLPPPPIPLVQPQQQTPVPTPAIVPSTSL
nr:hypothetical protein [Tanacetum cinerariifolium]